MIKKENKPFVEAVGKHPKGKKEERQYFEEMNPSWDSCCARYTLPFMKVDIDDRDHQTGAIKDAIKGQMKSDVICAMLDQENIRYNAVQTANGKHLYFKMPEGLLSAHKNNWMAAVGVCLEWKLPTSDDHIAVKRGGKLLEWVQGGLFNEDIDYLPEWLYPVQKSANKPFDYNITVGDRNNTLSSMLFYLVDKCRLTAEGAIKAVELYNNYILPDPLPKKELEVILRTETLEKLRTIEDEREEKKVNHQEVGEEVIQQFHPITVNDDFYIYQNGVYNKISEKEIEHFIRIKHPTLTINKFRETIYYVKTMTWKSGVLPPDAAINVRNGLLKIEEGQEWLYPHSKEEIRFSQFNAVYDPNATYKILDDALLKIFYGNTDQIDLFEQMMGYILMNHVRYGKVFFLIGKPSSGKSTILNMIIQFCGKENVSAITLSTMTEQFGLENIIGKTINVDADMGKIKIISSDTFKKLSTGDEVQIKRKHKSTVDYRCTAKFLFGMNQFPDFSNDFNGVQRRIVCIPFNHVFHKSDADYNPNIDDDLSSDECMSALLNKAIKGYKSLVANKGFLSTKESEKAAVEFKFENNNVLRWLSETEDIVDRLEREPIKNGYKGLYPDYVAYCIQIGEKEKSQREFTKIICEEYEFTTKQRRIPSEKTRSMFFVKK